METFDRQKHWQNIYENKALEEVSWYQPTPETSLEFFKKNEVSEDAKIIDIGGGDSFLVDHLLDLGYENLSVLDISAAAIERAKKRLGERATRVKWIVSDITSFNPKEQYDVWHDRAAFHFLTEKEDVAKYVDTARLKVRSNGMLFIGTFSEQGPKKCSGIDIQQYSEASLTERFSRYFKCFEGETVDHPTPFDTVQNFVFCSFIKK